MIVDDIVFTTEPVFRDEVVAQAKNTVVSQGVAYFLAAGNYGRSSWGASSGFNPVTMNGKTFHKFVTDSNGSPITCMIMEVEGDDNSRSLCFSGMKQFFQPVVLLVHEVM